jgi:hypothetical protein
VRTLQFLVAGLLLLAAFLLLAKLFSANYPDAARLATIAYVALWFIIAGVNMWVGGRESWLLGRRGAANFSSHLRRTRSCGYLA